MITIDMAFIEWIAKQVYLDVRGKYRVYKMGVKIPFDSINALYAYWKEEINT